VRDTKTGEIKSVVLRDEVPAGALLVVDDLCDGGRTFIELAKALPNRPSTATYLYVSHGIFSRGPDVLLGYYDKIFTACDWTDSKNPLVITL